MSEMRGLIFQALQFLRRNICISFRKGHSAGCHYSGRGWEKRYVTPVFVAAWCRSLSNVSPAGVVTTCLQGVKCGPEALTTTNAHIPSAPCFSSLLQLWNPWARLVEEKDLSDHFKLSPSCFNSFGRRIVNQCESYCHIHRESFYP